MSEALVDKAGAALGGASEPEAREVGHADFRLDHAPDLIAVNADRARAVLDEVPATLSDAAAAGEGIALRGRQVLDRGVRRQPVEALLLAGAIGYLVGWAASRG